MHRHIPHFLLLVMFGVCVLAYLPGLSGPFVFDDGPNILGNKNLRVDELTIEKLASAVLSGSSGLLQRPLSMFSFALNFFFAGDLASTKPEPFPFKITNLFIHLLNGLMVFILTKLLVGAYRNFRQPSLPAGYPGWLALVVAALWLLHPLNLTSVLYVVQRMTSLAALFTFAGMVSYVWGRSRLYYGERGGVIAVLCSLFIFLPLAMLSKENGALLPFLILVAEITLFRLVTAKNLDRYFLLGLFAVSVLLPTLIFISYSIQHPQWLSAGYVIRDFSLAERLMTESRAIWFYLRLILLPDTGLLGIYHDDFAISRQLLDPPTTLPAMLGIFGLFVAVWLLRSKIPLVAFGLLFFLVGHAMESSFLALELIHEHRNYLPMFGILLVVLHLLLNPLVAKNTLRLRLALVILLIPMFAATTFVRASAWGDSQELWETEVRHHPTSARANVEMGDLIVHMSQLDPTTIENNYPIARKYYETAALVQQNNVNGYFGLIRLSMTLGKPLEIGWLKELERRLEQEAIPANVNNHLITMAQCLSLPSCPLTKVQVESLLEAPLRNPRMMGREKARLLSATAYYQFNIARNHEAAVAAIRRSIEADPREIEYRISLVTVLIAMREFSEARKQIALAKRLDIRNARAIDIAKLDSQLDPPL